MTREEAKRIMEETPEIMEFMKRAMEVLDGCKTAEERKRLKDKILSKIQNEVTGV